MRILMVAAAATALAAPASAQVAVAGRPANVGCTSPVANSSAPEFAGELYVFKVPGGGSSTTDILFDVRNKGGQNAGGAAVGDATSTQWSAPPNWRAPQAPDQVHYAIITFAPEAGSQANRVMLDSGTISPFNYGFAMVQTVGDSLPAGIDEGIDLQLPGSATPYDVRLTGAAAAPVTGFPKGGPGAITVAFSPLAEVNRTALAGPCTIGGNTDPTGDPNGLAGLIIGYNVYRVADTGSTPTAAQFLPGFQYFMDIRTFAPQTGDGSPTGPGTDAATDMGLGDLAGFQNPDGDMYTGDEVLLFQDSGANQIASTWIDGNMDGTRDCWDCDMNGSCDTPQTPCAVARTVGTAPTPGTNYWYAFQPVVGGQVSDFSAVGFANGGSAFNGDHRLDMDMDGMNDAVDLDLNGTPEFISPQAEAGLPGLGLTWNSQIVMSNPVRGAINPAPAGGQISLTGSTTDDGVSIEFTTGLESGEVAHYNVYRLTGDARVKVNSQPILAIGGESNVYSLVDEAARPGRARLSRSSGGLYIVETVFVDGRTTEAGPFDLSTGSTDGARRTRR